MKLFGESLKVIRVLTKFWEYFTGERKTIERYDEAQLKKAYRKMQFIGPIVDLINSFLFGNYFKVSSEDENAQKILQDFWDDNKALLLQAGIENSLFGNTYLAFEYQEPNLLLKILSPQSVKKVLNPEKPWLIDGYEIKVTIEQKEIRQIITNQSFEFFVNGISQQKGDNPYGLIPIVHVTGTQFSDELFGTGDIDSGIYQLSERYEKILNKAVIIEDYHGAPIPVFQGVKDFSDLKTKLESEEPGKPGFGLYLPSKDSQVYFLESKRGTGNIIELLKLLYWGIVIQSRIPEYLFGVHIPEALASTREQRAPFENRINKRRLIWSVSLQEANKIILKMLEYHQGLSFVTDKTKIDWGPIFEKNRTEEADILDKKTKAIALLKELGLISEQTALESLSELIINPNQEKERIEEEKTKSESPY
uniref:Phage portal protein n=1 Tax=candidate division WOR-3 bacterium TaxID=2052148 RepID=A0A7C6EBU6_UNCW3